MSVLCGLTIAEVRALTVDERINNREVFTRIVREQCLSCEKPSEARSGPFCGRCLQRHSAQYMAEEERRHWNRIDPADGHLVMFGEAWEVPAPRVAKPAPKEPTVAKPLMPWHDCPPCRGPKPCGNLGNPIRTSLGRFYPPEGVDDDACTLWCPACGYGWVGTLEDVAQAERAEAAWEVAQVDEDAAEVAHKARLAEEQRAAEERAEYRRITGRDPSPAPQPAAGPEPVQLGLFGGGK